MAIRVGDEIWLHKNFTPASISPEYCDLTTEKHYVIIAVTKSHPRRNYNDIVQVLDDTDSVIDITLEHLTDYFTHQANEVPEPAKPQWNRKSFVSTLESGNWITCIALPRRFTNEFRVGKQYLVKRIAAGGVALLIELEDGRDLLVSASLDCFRKSMFEPEETKTGTWDTKYKKKPELLRLERRSA